MSPVFLFVASLVLALVGFVGAAIATVRTLTLKTAHNHASDADFTRSTRRGITVAIASTVLFVAATVLFFYIWISCAGEC